MSMSADVFQPEVIMGRRPIDGVLLLDKPLGMSSNHALQKARWLLQALKAGHTGVLDPMASGLLPVCFGEATKFSAFLLDADKAYRATVRFGQVSSTLDSEGEIRDSGEVSFDEAALRDMLARFTGEIEQVPPMHSALKFQGKALYEYARQGIEIERKIRRVTIHSLTLISFDGQTAVLDVACSKGTYIRTLAADLGEALGCGAYLTGLRRTKTAGFDVADAWTLEQLGKLTFAQRPALLLKPDVLVQHLPQLSCSEAETDALLHGQPVRFEPKDAIISQTRLYDIHGCFFGLGERRAQENLLWPSRLLARKAT